MNECRELVIKVLGAGRTKGNREAAANLVVGVKSHQCCWKSWPVLVQSLLPKVSGLRSPLLLLKALLRVDKHASPASSFPPLVPIGPQQEASGGKGP